MASQNLPESAGKSPRTCVVFVDFIWVEHFMAMFDQFDGNLRLIQSRRFDVAQPVAHVLPTRKHKPSSAFAA